MMIMMTMNVTCAVCQVTLCDPTWHASFRSGEASCITAIRVYRYTFYRTSVCNTTSLSDSNFIIRMLYKETY